MTTEINTFAPKKWTAEDFARASQANTTTHSSTPHVSPAQEPRSFGDVSTSGVSAGGVTDVSDTRREPVHAAATHHEIRTEAEPEAPMFASPISSGRTRTVKADHGRRVSPLALAAIPAVALAAGVAYFAMQPGDTQVADAGAASAPAAPILSDDAAAPLTTTTASANGGAASVSSTIPATRTPAAPTEVASRAATPVAVNRARPAAATAAGEAGVDVSATLPAGPQPYSSLTPSAPVAATPAPSAVAPPTIAIPSAAAPEASAAEAPATPTPSADATEPATPESATPGAAAEAPTP